MNWLILTLLAYFFWACSNILDKILIAKKIKPLGIILVTNIFYSLIILAIPFFDFQIPNTVEILILLGAGLLLFVSIIPYFKALQIEEVSRVTPLWQLSPIFVLILATLTIGENLILKQYIGFSLLLIGGLLISTRKIQGIFKLSKAFYLMLLATSIGAIYVVILKYFADSYNTWTLIVWIRIGMLLGTVLALLHIKYRQTFITTWTKLNNKTWILMLSEVITGLAGMVSWYTAVGLFSVSLITVLNGFQSLFLLVIASALSFKFPKLLKEEITTKTIAYKFIAIFLMFAGLFLVYNQI